jgi:hypothetical protein
MNLQPSGVFITSTMSILAVIGEEPGAPDSLAPGHLVIAATGWTGALAGESTCW